MESNQDCSSDYLEVSYTYLTFIPVTFRLCHEDHEFDLMSENRVMLMLHTNNQRTTSKGFRLEFTSSNCQPTYTKSNGRISFNNGLGPDKSEQCTFTINLNQPNLTVSAYIYTAIGSIGNQSIASFGLTAYNGPSTSSPVLTNYTLPIWTSPSLFSSGPSLTVSLKSTERWTGLFDISYTSTDQGKGCGGTLFNVRGTVTSPLYPAVYRKSSTCRWDIAVPRPYPIQIEFKSFLLGPSTTCTTDYLEIYDVDQVTRASTFVSKYCGGDHPANHIGRTGAVSIRYVTSEHNDGSGWVIYYRVKYNEF